MVDTHNPIRHASENEVIIESRIGLDGKWDRGIGLWFESSVIGLEANPDSLAWFHDVWNLGADYTFAIVNGLEMTVQYFR